MIDAKTKYSKEVAKKVVESLQRLQGRMEEAAKKAEVFRRETMQRKMQAQLSEVLDAVSGAEEELSNLKAAVTGLTGGSLEAVSTEELAAGCERATEVEKKAKAKCEDAHKLIALKKRDAKDTALVTELTKLGSRLTAASQDFKKHRSQIVLGEKMLKSKKILLEEMEKVGAVEEEVTKAEGMVESLGTETASEEALKKIDGVVSRAQSQLQAAAKSIQTHLAGSALDVPALKTALSKLVARARKAQEKLDGVKQTTRAQREKTTAQAILQEAEKKAAALDACLEGVSAAELPFLKGMEILPSAESEVLLKDSEKASEAVSKAVEEARSYFAQKLLEVRRFSKSVGNPAEDELNRLTEKITAGAQRASQFRKDTENRRRGAQLQDAAEQLNAAEVEVKKTMEAAEPFATEQLETITAEAASAICEKFSSLDVSAKAKLQQVRSVLAERQKDVRGHQQHEETLKKLQARMSNLEVDLSKARQAASEHEQKFVSRKLLSEAEDLMKEVEAQVTKVTSQAAPMVGKDAGSSFLAGNKVSMVAEALSELMKQKELTRDTLFKEASGGSEGGLDSAAFAALLDRLPAEAGREELTFPAEQKDQMFAFVDEDKDGKISAVEFERIFSEQYTCVHGIAITDAYEISSSKTVGKLEIGQSVQAIGCPRGSDDLGVVRLECKVLESGLSGWVTMKGNQGTLYLERCTPHAAFSKGIEKSVEVTAKGASRTLLFIKNKSAELGGVVAGPLLEAKNALAKLRPQVIAAQKRIDELRKQLAEANKDFAKREEAEKRSRQDVLDSKAAASANATVSEKVGAMDAALQAVEAATKPLRVEAEAELEAVERPISAMKTAKELADKAKAEAESAKTALRELQTSIPRASRGPLADARQGVLNGLAKAESMERKCKTLLDAGAKGSKRLSEVAHGKVAAALRDEAQRKGLEVDKLFDELAGAATAGKSESLAEDDLCKKLAELPDWKLPEEHARLACRHIDDSGSGSVSRRGFVSAVQQYFSCVKTIAMQNSFEISKGKTLRMLELSEILEVLEGPIGDEKVGVTRIRARALVDGVIGWVSLRGNAGTPFLEATTKPFVYLTADADLDADFRPAVGVAPMRKMKVDEAFEVLEGPRKDRYEDAERMKVIACKDGASGWMTLKDRDGGVHAEKGKDFYTCKSAIAITDARDIRNCKVLRKLAPKETFQLLEGPHEEKDAGVTRVRGRSMKDQTEGWITLKGNAGTVYAEPSSSIFVMKRDSPLQSRFSPSIGADALRTLAAGEALELVEGPKEEKFEAATRLKGRALSDGSIGWLTLKSNTQPWVPFYKCVSGTVIQDESPLKTAKPLRRIEVGEVFSLLEGPVAETDLGVLRIRARAEKDGLDGWITVRGNQGTVFLLPEHPKAPKTQRAEPKAGSRAEPKASSRSSSAAAASGASSSARGESRGASARGEPRPPSGPPPREPRPPSQPPKVGAKARAAGSRTSSR
eukprot:TRINITY_DN15043_c0_g2_i4.p1 TRINITY_DN15043_c0_g2~~TRINITY_DN15043_c0_g2_i4.p1  ORF type:complete len:1469 (-),score=473.54 TRINITY_DN15043_c0_g2_i4:347-4753(-)